METMQCEQSARRPAKGWSDDRHILEMEGPTVTVDGREVYKTDWTKKYIRMQGLG